MLHGLLVGNISLTVPHPRIFEGHLTSSPASFQNRSALGIHEVWNIRLATSRFLRPYGNTAIRLLKQRFTSLSSSRKREIHLIEIEGILLTGPLAHL